MVNFTLILRILQTLQTLQLFFTVNYSKKFGPAALYEDPPRIDTVNYIRDWI
ncbi:hypothetical protein B0H12DRAFT_1120544 [Mycena haematopus]|nr:hypothetical protein B0H12DRAFT_1120544 [Mycena haematopus]